MLNFHKHNFGRAFVDFLFDNDEKVACSYTHIMTRVQNHALFMTKMAKMDTLFMTKTTAKAYPLEPNTLLELL